MAAVEKVENIEKMAGQKAFLQVIMEFLFLKDEDFILIELEGSLLSYFGVNRKNRDEIKKHILAVYQSCGAEGIAEKYGHVVEETAEVNSTGLVLYQ